MTEADPGPIRAAGGVVWRPDSAGGVEIVVVRRPKYGDWTLPKGKLDGGETWQQAAVREVAEETGYTVTVGRYVGQIEYEKAGRPKVVRYWAMRANGGAFAPGDEVDALRWLPPPRVLEVLTYDRDREIIQAFLAACRQNAADLG